tara:strand:+ start:1250 stop:2305 length:1056 start_codon:yes stop_codon:yes gene_type:complete
MIDYIVNNSISHPPHPRRAVPANLPPGAFLFNCIRLFWMKTFLISSFFSLGILGVFGDNESDLSFKIKELRLKSNAHGKFVSQLLANEINLDPIEKLEFSTSKNTSSKNQPLDSINLPVIDIPVEPEETPLPSEVIIQQIPSTGVEERALPLQPEASDSPTNVESSFNKEGKSTYEELYSPKHPQRRIGYYFGPFIGTVFPDDSSVKPTGTKENYNSKGGAVGGFRLGNDFGSARIEAEYGFLTHEIESSLGSGDTNIHNLKSRLILEKSLGGRADIRGGIGLGVAFINKDLAGKEYDGVGFSYDFLLGWSYRVMDNWSINLDYRHYLTAAHKNYDRLQGHIIEFSAGFDL